MALIKLNLNYYGRDSGNDVEIIGAIGDDYG